MTVATSAQPYHTFMNDQRQLYSNNQGSQNFVQNNYGQHDTRPRGWSNTSWGERGKAYRNNFSGNRPYVPKTPTGSPFKGTLAKEPVYILNQQSPHNLYPPTSMHRIVSEPMPNVAFNHNSGIAPLTPSSQEQLARNSQSVVQGSPTNDRLQTPRASSMTQSGSRVRPTSIVPSNSGMPINDARFNSSSDRKLFEEYRYTDCKEKAAVRHYAGGPVRNGREEQGNRTVHISGFSFEQFNNDTIKEMMGECGDIDMISCFPATGRAFVV